MAMPQPRNRADELRHEQEQLVKAEVDIEQGRTRLRNQQDLLSWRQTAGGDTSQAERLLQLMQHTLVEWERHRGLIEDRIALLEKELSGG
jgi:hypothetical protein